MTKENEEAATGIGRCMHASSAFPSCPPFLCLEKAEGSGTGWNPMHAYLRVNPIQNTPLTIATTSSPFPALGILDLLASRCWYGKPCEGGSFHTQCQPVSGDQNVDSGETAAAAAAQWKNPPLGSAGHWYGCVLFFLYPGVKGITLFPYPQTGLLMNPAASTLVIINV